ncbi:HlyD family efflux transporter periplasmic adaptor subunit [Candidatus Binatia bacterium]|nr:HlyD family efflux transporter periplasmic adaptor subunit [Candidatus Binatia bacterium]
MAAADDPIWQQRLARLLSLVIVVAAVAVAGYVTLRTYRRPRTDDAAVRANIVGIAPHVSGPIVELPIVDNQDVPEGALLFLVDPRPYEAALAQAKAELLLAQAEIDAIGNAVAAARAEVERLEAEATYSGDHVRRLEPLVPQQFVTRDRFEEAQTRQRAATAAVEKARQELARQESLLAQFGELNARRAAAEAAVWNAELNVGYCRVVAPFPARVTNLNLSRGEYAVAGRQVFALVDTRHWYVLANFQETYLESIRPGMPVEVFLLSYPGHRVRGWVQGVAWAISPLDGGNVGVLPKVDPTLNWVRLANRIPVRVELEPPTPERPYRMGMTAVVTVVGDSDNRGDAASHPVAAAGS